MINKIVMYGALLVSMILKPTVDGTVKATSHAMVPLQIIVIDEVQEHPIATRLQEALSFSGQFQVTICAVKEKLSKQSLQALFKKGTPLALVLHMPGADKMGEWRIYDTMNQTMVAGKKYSLGSNDHSWTALYIAQHVWPELTGQQGFFTTKIAYCKSVPHKKAGSSVKHIYIAAFDGKDEQLLVDTPTLNLVPRWNRDSNNPLLLYSEYTHKNMRMNIIDPHKKKRVASDFDGVNMLATFSADGKKVVYCASRGDGNCQLYYYAQDTFKRLTFTDPVSGRSLAQGNNISPTLSDDGNTVYFCSDFLTGVPQIYLYDIAMQTVTPFIKNGTYCASPAYCHTTKRLAYTKKIDGRMQLFVYDTLKKTHTQLTHDSTTKDECSWSPCGNYIAVAIEQAGSSRVAIYSLITQDMRYITTAASQCSYPCWSPLYNSFPSA